ncbi:ATP-binding protein [Paenibacillus arenilitoris]|uniref:histidine kinase n=1 Tax=Paenibacillus arenilitoris TaxID=2772299 RepID=A0A927CVD4_9BACL|nr:ATP-binding protein [Paenibacillus arenilitoris]MBD2872901.1 hypothetical protein [Paenibacillus arenilitoris]
MNDPIIQGDPYYLSLSLIIMSFASYTMLNMIEQQPKERADRFNWNVGGAAVFGLGIWTMHVVSLLASDYRIIIDWTMLLILLVCVIIIYSALLVLRRTGLLRARLPFSAILMAVGSTLLHYTSMLSDSVSRLHMNWMLYALSFLASFAGAYLAFYWLERRRSGYMLRSSLALGFANMLMHQLGLHALTIEYDTILSTDLFNDYLFMLAFMLGIFTLIILSFSLTTWFSANRYSQINERYRLLVENSMDTIALISDGKWEYMNRAGLLLFETNDESDMIGKGIYRQLVESCHGEMEDWLKAGSQGEGTPARPIELQWKSMKGKPLHTEIVRASTTFSGRQIEQVIIRDISERKKNEELLINSEKLYVAGQLAAGIAHEIRNPLTSLKGFLQLIATGRASNGQFYAIMKSELVRIESIVSELLMLSKPQMYDFTHRDVRQIMAETVTLLETQAILHDVVIELRAEERPLWVLGVENQLKQVFINVIKNAIEAMPDGGVVSIDMSLDDAGAVGIRIRDEGCGISKEQLSTLGQPFYTTKDKGTGLGLMVTYKIVDNHQGQIAAESEMGVGTTFSIRLPFKERPVASEALMRI